MAIFQHPLWGFELTYPDGWVQQTRGDTDGFAETISALEQVNHPKKGGAHLLVRGEWNGRREPIAPLWNQHITKLSIMLSAKRIGSSPFSMGGANGFEAEIALPKRENRRLWVGILAHDTIVLHLMVSHPKTDRERFEPLATQVISSLRFVDRVAPVFTSEEGLPLPPGYSPANPATLIPDIGPGETWQAYTGGNDPGSLQAFYYRELPQHGWEITEFIPYPNQVDVHFARVRIHRDGLTATLGILPTAEKNPHGSIVIRYA